jgi:ankyrin repeat protein
MMNMKRGLVLLLILESCRLSGAEESKTPLLDALKNQDMTSISKEWSGTPAVRAAKLKEVDAEGNTPLLVAVYLTLTGDETNQASSDLIREMLAVASPEDKTVRNHQGNTVLHVAQISKVMGDLLDDKVIRGLYNATNRAGLVPLHIAVTANSARKLLENYPEAERKEAVNVYDNAGNTPLFYVRDDPKMDYLFETGAMLGLVNNEGKTPLMFVLTVPSFEFTAMPGVNIRKEFRDRIHKTTGLLSDREIRSTIAHHFIEHGKDLKVKIFTGQDVDFFDVVDNTGNTAVHYAIKADLDPKNKKEFIAEILRVGAKKDVKNFDGKTPADLLKEEKGKNNDFANSVYYDEVLKLIE